MRASFTILCAIVAATGTALHAEVVPPRHPDAETFALPRGVNASDAGGVALGAGKTTSDWSRTSNLDSLGADLLILDYQTVAMSVGEDANDGVLLSVLTSDVRRDRTMGDVATRFFAPARHLWQGAAEVNVSPVQAYDLPTPTLDLSSPNGTEPESPDIGAPTSSEMLGSLSLIGLLSN